MRRATKQGRRQINRVLGQRFPRERKLEKNKIIFERFPGEKKLKRPNYVHFHMRGFLNREYWKDQIMLFLNWGGFLNRENWNYQTPNYIYLHPGGFQKQWKSSYEMKIPNYIYSHLKEAGHAFVWEGSPPKAGKPGFGSKYLIITSNQQTPFQTSRHLDVIVVGAFAMIMVRLQETEHFLFVTPEKCFKNIYSTIHIKHTEKCSKDDILKIPTTLIANLNPEVLSLGQYLLPRRLSSPNYIDCITFPTINVSPV